MNINNIPKFVINLERRLDRLEKIKNELKYIGWDYEIFKAIDKNNHTGCSLSHLEIIKMALNNNLDEIIVIEDDCTFMPYSKDLVNAINLQCHDLDYYVINLSPTINRPVNVSEKYNLLLDLTNLPEKKEQHRGIFATNMILYHKKSFELILNLELHNNLEYYAIDDWIYRNIMSEHQSYSPILPIAPQLYDWSDISQGKYNNFYTQTYNWNLYSPIKIPKEFLNYEKNQEIKLINEHKTFNYVG